MSSPLRPVLRVKRHSTVSVLGRAYAMNNGFAADTARFSSPNPPLPVFQAQITKVEDANKLAKAHIKGAAQTCALERNKLVSMLQTECAYVRTLCDASPEQSAAIIQAAGLFSALVKAQEQAPLRVKRGTVSGTVELFASLRLLIGARDRKGKFFNWQWTTDGGQTFHDAPTTPKGRITIANLTPFTTVGFRAKVTTTKVDGEWTQIISIVVH